MIREYQSIFRLVEGFGDVHQCAERYPFPFVVELGPAGHAVEIRDARGPGQRLELTIAELQRVPHKAIDLKSPCVLVEARNRLDV